MPTTRKGGKPNQRARIQSLQIGQLETTPTSRHLQSRRVDDKPDPPSAQQPPQASANEFEDKIDDADLMVLDDEQDVPKDFWSEAASTHRSTPAPEAGRAHFDSPSSVIDDFSSLRSGSGKLPSTQPLPSQLVAGPQANNYDFSETATTARRSSPVQPHNTLSQAALDRAWEYPENNTVPELPGTIPESYQVPEIDTMKHLPENELYDATPASEEEDQAPNSAEAKGSVLKRAKQKVKPVLEFDATTQKVIEPQRKTANQSPHKSMVESMRQAYAASVSPTEGTKKPTPKPRKKPSPTVAKKAATKAASKAPPKPSPKAALKVAKPCLKTTLKPARKAAAAAARRITRQSALVEELTQPSSDEANIISPAVERADPVAKTSATATKKTTTTKTIVKTEPSLQPAKAQEEPKAMNNTQGSTENPILLSSAGSSSSLSDVDDFAPPNDQAEIPPLRRTTAREKSITVRADPKEPLLQRTSRPPIRIGPGEVLSARDANMLAQYNAPKGNTLKRTTTTRDTLVDTSAPPRKVMKRSRSFSISQAGSPLPVDATGYPVEETSPIDAEEYEPSPIPYTNKQTNGLQQDLHAQILASLQVPDEKLPEVHDDKARDEEEATEQTLPKGPSEELSEELHGFVKTVLRRLQAKEEDTIYRTADVYQKNSIDCVGKIERKYEQEKQLLSKTWKQDGDRFVRDSRSARAALDKQRKLRQEATRTMQETVARRQYLFQKAITSLHALHGRLTDRQAQEDEDQE
ncbi:uncharacterized protein B0J16DRAFT_371382 [Fusarium flagelliforme]|uniref:Uncharacterized protein n=1 Tax=Fusarium flagelliforme TaxID=2675880 RepID=A0A395MRR6_9HYPO|nr:uncharacterized protein B0J16DRAFT_371382 [Fusarium flagelliforme]KAH7189545.1 hypothetical protein B0J16DRAFT_371382 [Fusarium flagelliforme]RFN50113.1 hypothetical protein FIE12Z_5641 [Fusarium flagelliforme]